jgi:hypothetical protein
MYIKTQRFNVPIHQKTKLFACHTESDSTDFLTIVAEVSVLAEGFVMKNVSPKSWFVNDTGKSSMIASGAILKLHKGIEIDFGGSTAKII